MTQPRLPCFKLGIKMGREEFVTEFLERGLLGFYFAVAREGEVEAGDPIVELSRDPHGFRVTEVARLYARDRDDVEGLQRAAEPRRASRELARLLPQASLPPRTRRRLSAGEPTARSLLAVLTRPRLSRRTGMDPRLQRSRECTRSSEEVGRRCLDQMAAVADTISGRR